MKNLRRILLSLMIVIIVSTMAISFAACGNKDNGNEEIVIWAWNKNVDAINAGIKLYKETVDPSFNAKVESFARMDIDKKFKTASQTDNQDSIADIVLCDGFTMLTYYDLWSNIFTDISSYISADEKAKVVQSTLDSVEVDGKLLGLPLDVAPTVVFANKKLWDEETLNRVAKEGWTWDEYLSIGKEIKSAKGDNVYMTAYNMRGDDRIYRAMVSQKGEWFMDMKYNVQVGNENSITAMTKIKAMQDAGVVGHIDTGDYKSLMKNNQIAAQIQGFFLGGQFKDVAPEMSGDWAILPLPKWNKDDKTSASITGGSYLYANSKLTGTKKDKAVDFIKFMTLNNEAAISSLKVGGVYPALATAYDTEYFKTTKDEFFGNDIVWKNVASWSIDAKAIFATKYNGFNYDTFIKAQEKILFTTDYKSIEDVLTGVANAMRNNAK